MALEEIAPTSARAQSEEVVGAPGGIGLEIVTIADLPDAENYSDHEFYYENFSPLEIAYSIRRASAKASFGALLAAKKAIVKSGAAIGPLEGLGRIEIVYDAEGRPTYPGCLLSISQGDAIAAAVALRQNGIDAPSHSPANPAASPSRRRPDLYIGLVLAALLFLFGFGLWKILGLAFGKHF